MPRPTPWPAPVMKAVLAGEVENMAEGNHPQA